MSSFIIQDSPLRKSHSKNKPSIQPKTNTSFNIFSQLSINKNPNSQKQLNNSEPIQLSNQKISQKHQKKPYTSVESSPLINPFSIQNSKPQTLNESSQPKSKSPLTAKFNQKSNQIKDQSTGWGHSLIKFIIQRSTNRTIQHQINIIPPNLILHKKPPEAVTANETVRQTQTALVSGKKLNKVYSKIRNQFRNLQLIKEKSQSNHSINKRVKSSHSLVNRQKDQQRTKQSLTSTKSLTLTKSSSQIMRKKNRLKTQPNNKMIIPSGLVTYRFKSLKTQNSLIYNLLNNKSSQQLLQNQLKSIKDRLNCATHRAHKIQYRSVGKKLQQTKHKQVAFRQGLVKQQLKDMSTSQYLRHVLDEKIKIDKIYGQQGSRLQYISYLMNELSLQRPLAQESVEFIDQMVRQELGLKKSSINPQKDTDKRQQYYGSDQNQDNIMLSHRKRMIYKPKRTRKLHEHKLTEQYLTNRSGVVLNHLTFLNEY